jgi:predicted DNA repair protein MutK
LNYTFKASRFFALFEAIASLMDDVVLLSKVAAKKTARILDDDFLQMLKKYLDLYLQKN